MKVNLKTCISEDKYMFLYFDKHNNMMILLNMGLITKIQTQKKHRFLLVNYSELLSSHMKILMLLRFESDRMPPFSHVHEHYTVFEYTIAHFPVSAHQCISRVMWKPTMWFSNRSNTNCTVQAQTMARGWTFWI